MFLFKSIAHKTNSAPYRHIKEMQILILKTFENNIVLISGNLPS